MELFGKVEAFRLFGIILTPRTVGCILLIPVALSLGELGSSMPTAGGLYYVS